MRTDNEVLWAGVISLIAADRPIAPMFAGPGSMTPFAGEAPAVAEALSCQNPPGWS